MASPGIATAFENKIDALLGQWVNGVSGAFISALTPLALAAFTVYITLLGWQISRGEISDPVPQILKRLLRLAVIGGIALGVGLYQTYVIGLSNGATAALVGTITAGGVAGVPATLTIGNTIDNVMVPYSNFWNLLTQNFTNTLFPSFALILSAFFVALAEFFVVIISLGFYLLVKVELAMCLAVGPVFILLAAFESTAAWTRRWIGQLWHYSMQQALMAAAISMLGSVLINATNTAYQNYQSNGAGSVFGDVLAVFCISLCVAVLVFNIGALTQALTGAVGGIGQPSGSAGAAAVGKAVRAGKAIATKGASLVKDMARGGGERGGAAAVNQLRLPSGSAGGGGSGSVPAAQVHVTDNL